MKKTLKWIALSLAALVTLLLTGSYLNHRLRLPQEIAAYPPPGQLVAVNGHRLHVYSEGSGEPTLVFMSGSGTTAPTLDFRGLYRRLSDDYRIVVVERAGYGWSDDSDTPRDIDTVLAETRLALQNAGENPPYVLLPHSLSGLEAIHWANRYPDEVAAIVGLDPSVPAVYAEIPPPRTLLRLAAFTARSGLLRLVPAVCHGSEAVSAGHLTAEETAVYCAMIYRRTWSANMLAETRLALQAAGENPPYVLLPHSLSGLEAIHWANRYPDEVAAIVGLDPSVPAVYAEIPPPWLLLRLAAFTARSGLLRLVPAVCHGSEAVSEGHLTAEETAVYCAMIYRRTWSANMLAETDITQANAKLVAATGIPAVPIYLFISNGAGLPVPDWVELLMAYAEAAPDGRYELLDVNHYVHNLAADALAEKIQLFLPQLARN